MVREEYLRDGSLLMTRRRDRFFKEPLLPPRQLGNSELRLLLPFFPMSAPGRPLEPGQEAEVGKEDAVLRYALAGNDSLPFS